MNPILSTRELNVLTHLAEGNTYQQTQNALGLTRNNLNVTTHLIRRKTGIKDTTNPKECMAWLRKPRAPSDPMAQKIAPRPLRIPVGSAITTTQLDVLTRLNQGQTHAQIAAALGIKPGTSRLHACQGRKALGLSRTWTPQRVEPSINVDDY